MRKFLFQILTLQILFISSAHSQLYIEETFFPVYIKVNDARNSEAGGGRTENVPTESGIGTDFRTTIGYAFSTGIILGVTYNMYSVNTTRPETATFESVDKKISKTELGPTVGYSMGTWKFLLTYFVMGEKSLDQYYVQGTPTLNRKFTNTSISGFQFTINYGLPLGKGFEIGPSLVYRSVSYGKQRLDDRLTPGNSYGDSTMMTDPIDDELRPMVTAVYRY